jgi:hypothetical protein
MCFYLFIFIYRYSALGPVRAETRAQSGDWYGSGTLHLGQIRRGSLPLLSPAFRSSHFRHQVPPRPPRRERSQRRKVELWARILSGNFAEMTTSAGSFTCRKSTTWDRGLYFPSKGRRAEDFFAGLRPGLNPRTWVLKARMLPLDHRSRNMCYSYKNAKDT